MILEFGIADQPGSSGFYSGTIVSFPSLSASSLLTAGVELQDSAFAVAQVCAIYHFSRLSGVAKYPSFILPTSRLTFARRPFW